MPVKRTKSKSKALKAGNGLRKRTSLIKPTTASGEGGKLKKVGPQPLKQFTKAELEKWQRENSEGFKIIEAMVDGDIEWARWGDGFLPQHITEHLTKVLATGRKSVEAIVETGQHLREMKDALCHGEWLWVFERELLPFGERTAQMHVRIAKHRVLSNPHSYALLPPTLNALYLLSGLPAETVEGLIKSGTVTPASRIEDTSNLYVLKFPQLLDDMLNLRAGTAPAVMAQTTGYELWRHKQDGVQEFLLEQIAWLTAFKEAYALEEATHGEKWQGWLRTDERKAEAERAEEQGSSAAAHARTMKGLTGFVLKQLENKGDDATVTIKLPNDITYVVTYQRDEQRKPPRGRSKRTITETSASHKAH